MANFDHKLAFDQWSTRLDMAHQTREDVYAGLMEEVTLNANREFFKINGTLDLTGLSTEDQAQVHSERDYEERQIQASQAYVAIKFDSGELARGHTNPTAAWTEAAIMGMHRWNAAVKRTAATGDATAQYEGESTSSTKSLSGNQVIAVGAASMNETKVKSVRSRFMKNKALKAGQEVYLSISQEEEDFLTTLDVFRHNDYLDKGAVTSGVIAGRLYGVTLVRDEDLAVSSSVRTCFAWVKSGVKFGVQQGVFTRNAEIQNRHYMREFYLRVDNGATRTRETDVMQVLTTVA